VGDGGGLRCILTECRIKESAQLPSGRPLVQCSRSGTPFGGNGTPTPSDIRRYQGELSGPRWANNAKPFYAGATPNCTDEVLTRSSIRKLLLSGQDARAQAACCAWRLAPVCAFPPTNLPIG
jgi:hypothetical protein